VIPQPYTITQAWKEYYFALGANAFLPASCASGNPFHATGRRRGWMRSQARNTTALDGLNPKDRLLNFAYGFSPLNGAAIVELVYFVGKETSRVGARRVKHVLISLSVV
jgi:hypothetical protein